MSALSPMIGRAARGLRKGRWVALGLAIPAALVFASWLFTAPLESPEPPASTSSAATPTSRPTPTAPDLPPAARPAWPEVRLEGRDAKLLLMVILDEAARQVESHPGYTATFKKEERVNGTLLPEQVMAMKVRRSPFAIYLKFATPYPGKEVIYAEGLREGRVIAHNGDWTRRFFPRLLVEPTSATAMNDNRHPITEAGLANLVRKLIGFRRLDLIDDEAATILDRTTTRSGQPRLRSIHTHEHKNATRPFLRVEVLYDPATYIPLEVSSFDWPPASTPARLILAERYTYEDLDFSHPPTDFDFDPTNPAYGFHRY